ESEAAPAARDAGKPRERAAKKDGGDERPAKRAEAKRDGKADPDKGAEPSGKRKKGVIAGVAAAVAAVAVIAVVAAAALGGGPAVRDSVNDYTWEELSAISQEISKAGGEDAAIEVAKKYHLATADGKLDGTQVKDIELTDGTKAQVQIVGFAHDEKADGSGKAGITFMFTNAIASHPMDTTATNEGGWEKSQLREWLNREGLNKLPGDLRNAIIEVEKLTNNTGFTKVASSVTPTSDKLWLPSVVELSGAEAGDDWPWKGSEWAAEIYDSEGIEYRLFDELGTDPFGVNPVLARSYNNNACMWWTRTPAPGEKANFRFVSNQGSFGHTKADDAGCVIPGFCV
ncbi:MAG: hypothetical protein HFJ75_07320, partial [Eggerthellaceae bacterium]|nr:hypothetical protein [Eggerthellaceae bacterium]